MTRWMTYQRERFPLVGHAPLVAAFSTSAVCFSSLLRGQVAIPSVRSLIVAFGTSLLFFLQLRIADEFKDHKEDAQYRPYRPVPRGLVTLGELRIVALAAAAAQIGLALWIEPSLTVLLVGVWIYLALMTREFFLGPWLRSRPILYMGTHMVILPLVDAYATACDWWVAGLSRPPDGLVWFLAVSFLNGIVIEIGRKTRAPQDEEPGVETYSALWGVRGAVRAWLAAIVLTGAATWMAASLIGTADVAPVWLLVLLLACARCGARLMHSPEPGAGYGIEVMSGVWTLVMYLGLGTVPLIVAVWST